MKTTLHLVLVFALALPPVVSAAPETPTQKPVSTLVSCARVLALMGAAMWGLAGIAAVDGNVTATSAIMSEFRFPWQSDESIRLAKEAKHRENMQFAGRIFSVGGIALVVSAGLAVVDHQLRRRPSDPPTEPLVTTLKITGIPDAYAVRHGTQEVPVVDGNATIISLESDGVSSSFPVVFQHRSKATTVSFVAQIQIGTELAITFEQILER